MKKEYLMFLLGACLVYGCTEDPVAVENDNGPTVINAVFEDCPLCRTQMTQGNSPDTYKVFWEDSDRIHVNGIASEGIQINENTSRAAFSFGDRTIAPPFSCIYSAGNAPAFNKSTILFASLTSKNSSGLKFFISPDILTV